MKPPKPIKDEIFEILRISTLRKYLTDERPEQMSTRTAANERVCQSCPVYHFLKAKIPSEEFEVYQNFIWIVNSNTRINNPAWLRSFIRERDELIGRLPNGIRFYKLAELL